MSTHDFNELSTEQQFALRKFQRGENVFISGPGGSGKSHLIRYFVDEMHTHARIHQVTSTTGCSSILLSNQIRIAGKPIVVKTIHSWSGIRLGKGTLSDLLHLVMKNRRVVKEWRRIKTLVLDEVSMLSEKLFTALEYLARMIRNNDKPFGGIQLICLGDFFQLPPVGDEQEPSTMNFAFESPAWKRVFSMDNHVELVTIYRQQDDRYKQILHEVRHATLSDESRRQLETRVGLEYRPEDHHGIIPMKLFATRAQVQRINTAQYEKIEQEEHVYTLTSQTDMRYYVENGAPLEDEVLTKCQALSMRDVEFECQSLTNQLPVEADVYLKIGAPVMCLVNLDVEAGIANGSMGVIVDFVSASPDDIVDICNNSSSSRAVGSCVDTVTNITL
jgi:ATP-dependent DNA helicase PIF1